MDIENRINFSFGFIRGMKDIQDDKRNMGVMWQCHTRDFADGYDSALMHFDGICTHGTDYARKIGLVKIYQDFHGQSSFEHPTEV